MSSHMSKTKPGWPAFLALLASPLLLYAAWMLWDVHKVKAFCDDVRPGAPLATLAPLAARHGIAAHWINRGVFDDKAHDRVMFVPAGTTLGDLVCAVHHDDTSVVSAEIRDDR